MYSTVYHILQCRWYMYMYVDIHVPQVELFPLAYDNQLANLPSQYLLGLVYLIMGVSLSLSLSLSLSE